MYIIFFVSSHVSLLYFRPLLCSTAGYVLVDSHVICTSALVFNIAYFSVSLSLTLHCQPHSGVNCLPLNALHLHILFLAWRARLSVFFSLFHILFIFFPWWFTYVHGTHTALGLFLWVIVLPILLFLIYSSVRLGFLNIIFLFPLLFPLYNKKRIFTTIQS